MKEITPQDELLINELVILIKDFYQSKGGKTAKQTTLKEKENSIIYLNMSMNRENIEFRVFAKPKESNNEYHLSTKNCYSIGQAIDYIQKLKWIEYEQ